MWNYPEIDKYIEEETQQAAYEAQIFNENVKGNTAFSNPYDDSGWDGE